MKKRTRNGRSDYFELIDDLGETGFIYDIHNNVHNINNDDSYSYWNNYDINDDQPNDDQPNDDSNHDKPPEDGSKRNNDDENSIVHNCLTFNIISECSNLLEILDNKNFPDDFNSIIDETSNTTKQQFCERYLNLAGKHSINDAASNALMFLLGSTFPNINFPTNSTISGSQVCTAKKYVVRNKINPILEFHVCGACNKEVYVGEKQLSIKCSICNSNRFTNCSHIMCRHKNYDECPHSYKNRIPKAVVYYKPLIPLILSLLEMPEFLNSFKFQYTKPFSTNADYEIMDVLDGKVAKHHLQLMENANTYLKNANPDYSFLNLLLGEFFDGTQVYKLFKNCWPLLTLILNLPPTFRSRLAAGVFMSSIYGGGELGSPAERFTHKECYLNELKALERGVLFEVNDDDTKSKKKVFVRAHLIQLLYDTKAAEQEIQYQATGSIAGCVLCKSSQRGTYRSTLNKTVYADLRKYLDPNHFLRIMGNSTQPNPLIFYSDSESNIFEYLEMSKDAESEAIKKSMETRNINPRQLNAKSLDKDIYRSQRAEFLNVTKPYVWHHLEFDFDEFKGQLHYPHCQIHPKVELDLISEKEFKTYGEEADTTGKACNGIKGSLFLSKLSYFDISKHFCYDPFHSLGGICAYYISILKGKKSCYY